MQDGRKATFPSIFPFFALLLFSKDDTSICDIFNFCSPIYNDGFVFAIKETFFFSFFFFKKITREIKKYLLTVLILSALQNAFVYVI